MVLLVLLPFCVAPGGESIGWSRSSSSSSSEEVADWQCLRVTFGRQGLLLRGVSKGREVYGELLLPVSFFDGFEYQRHQQQQEQQQRQQQQQEEGESVLVPLKSFVNALLLFGEAVRAFAASASSHVLLMQCFYWCCSAAYGMGLCNSSMHTLSLLDPLLLPYLCVLLLSQAHMRLRYTFGEGVLLLLLQQPQQQPNKKQQVFSEIAIKTYSVADVRPDLIAAFTRYC